AYVTGNAGIFVAGGADQYMSGFFGASGQTLRNDADIQEIPADPNLSVFARYGNRPSLRPAMSGVLNLNHPSLHPGGRRWWRVGRLGTAIDGVGAIERAPRFYHGVAAIRRAGRAVPGEFGRVAVQRHFR